MNAEKLAAEMTLEEKASLTSGLDVWHTKAVERLGIEQIMMTDGPHGLRKREGSETVPATCFPTASALAASWDRSVTARVGDAMAKQAIANGVAVILGPGVNMKRSPLCGRNFEYYSEDPYQAGEMAVSFVSAIEKNNVGTSLKHYAANSQETRRFSTSSELSERALREIYLPAFEAVVKRAHPATVMEAYNLVNGEHMSNSGKMLTKILRDEWGFDGVVVTDWEALYERVTALEAGCDLEMPTSHGVSDREIVRAVREGRLDEKVLDISVIRILGLIEKYGHNEKKPADLEAHHSLAREIASECMVLLKNDGTLPLSSGAPLAVLGNFAAQPRIQGIGSSRVNPYKTDDILSFITAENGGETVFAKGYEGQGEVLDNGLIAEAAAAAKKCGRALVFIGLPDSYEAEGRDRNHMKLPPAHLALLSAARENAEKVIVVLTVGAPVEMPWADSADAILLTYLGGEAVGGAAADILFGKVCPSGRLAETFPLRLEDNPTFGHYPSLCDRAVYSEDIFIGYRWYEVRHIPVLFPFGFGLSYTEFEYESIKTDGANVTVTLRNRGSVAGMETVQLYVGKKDSRVPRPVKELRGFEKVFLRPGESKTVSFELPQRAFSRYDERAQTFVTDPGEYVIYAGGSSADTPLSAVVEKSAYPDVPPRLERDSVIGSIADDRRFDKISYELFSVIFSNTDYAEQYKKFGNGTENTVLRRRRPHVLRQADYENPQIDEKTLTELIERLNAKLAEES